jgi:hypothetical protein
MEINVVEKQKNKRIKNVEVLSLSLHNEFIHIATQAALNEIGYCGRLYPSFNNRLPVLITANLNRLYNYRLDKNINKKKKKVVVKKTTKRRKK